MTGTLPTTQPRQPRRSRDDFSPVSDLFAPFFDVVFYSLSEVPGVIANLEDQVRLLSRDSATEGVAGALAANVAALRALPGGKSPADIADTETIGASRLQLSSVGGGLQTFDPAGPDSPLGQLVNYRANLQVSMLSAAALQATLTLTPPYEDALRIIDHQAIKFGSLMEIQWGYLSLDGGKPSVSDKGLFRITQPSIKFGREVSITIGGFDILSSSLSTVDVRCCWPRARYKCDLSILRALFARDAPANIKLDDALVGDKSSLRREKTEDVIQADDNWTFFRRLCRQNDVSFAPSSDGTTILLKDESRIDSAKPKYRLTWFMQPQSNLDIPMIAFETNPIMGYFAGEGARGQRTFCRDRDTGEVRVINNDPSKTGTRQLGAAATDVQPAGFKSDGIRISDGEALAAFNDLQKNACASGRIFTQPCQRPNQAEETERENREVRRFHNTRATATVPGVPGLIPQQICEIVNVGKIFSGCYRIMKAVHNIGAGYTVQVDLIRASSTATKDGTPATKDGANCQLVDPNQPTGEEVTPQRGDDPPIRTEAGENAGCIDLARTTEALKIQTGFRMANPNIVAPTLATIDAGLQAKKLEHNQETE